MDPTNSSISTSNPVPGPTPVPGPSPVPPVTPSAPVPPVPPVDLNEPVSPTPVPSPTVPPVETPVVPPVAPEAGGEIATPGAEQPIDAVETTTPPAAESAVGNDFATPVPPIARPTNIDGINSTPVVESNNMPPVGAEDVSAEPASAPGAANGQSIDGILSGNAFATPANTPSVSFADPAAQPEANNNVDASQPASAMPKKKSNKAVLIALSVIAFVVAAVLGVVLVMMLNEWGPFGSGNSGGNNVVETGDNGNNNGGNGDKDDDGSGDEDNTGGGENGDDGGAVVNPGEDTIVCTMVQDDTSSDGETGTSTITMTLYFANNNFSRVSLRGETTSESSTAPVVTTMDMSAAELLEMGGIDWEEAGIRPNDDGSVAATKDQVMSALSSSYDGMTCINPSSM